MAGELFGIPNGLRAAQDDQIALSELALKQQQAASSQAFNAAQTQHQLALTKLNEAQAGAITRKAETEAAMQKMMGGLAMQGPGAPQGGEQPASPLAAYSQADQVVGALWKQTAALAALGRVEEAGKLALQASGAGENIAQQRSAAASAEATRLRGEAAKHEFVTQVLSGVRDPASHAQALMILRSNPMTANDEIPPGLRTYNQRAIDAVLAGSRAAKQKADMAQDASRTASQNANDANLRQTRNSQLQLARQRMALADEREDRLAAAAGGKTPAQKPLAPPTKAEIQMVKNLAKSLDIDVDSDDAAIFHQSMAEQVKALITSNPGLSRQEATMQVMREAKDRGELVTSGRIFSSTGYKPGEGSVTMPLPLPTSRDALKTGQYYRDPTSGEVRQFTGAGWKSLTKGGK